jgi:hypothetical protein
MGLTLADLRLIEMVLSWYDPGYMGRLQEALALVRREIQQRTAAGIR